MRETMYLVDLQDTDDYNEMSIEAVRDFLYNHWEDEEDWDDEDNGETLDEFLERIKEADWDTLGDMLSGIGYCLAEDEEDAKGIHFE